MKLTIIPLFAAFTSASAYILTTSGHEGSIAQGRAEGIVPCGNLPSENPWVTLYRAPSDPFGERDMAQRMVYLLGDYRKYGIEAEFVWREWPHIKFDITPHQKRGSLFESERTTSNYTAMIDFFFDTKEAGIYEFDFRAADAGIVQLGTPTGECDHYHDDMINSQFLFRKFDSGWAAQRRVFLEGGSTYPVRIIVTNLFYRSGMDFNIRGPDGKSFRFGDDGSNSTQPEPSMSSWPEEDYSFTSYTPDENYWSISSDWDSEEYFWDSEAPESTETTT